MFIVKDAEGHVALGGIGNLKNSFEPFDLVMKGGGAEGLLENMLPALSQESLNVLYNSIGDFLKYQGKERARIAAEPCRKCCKFRDKGYGFGGCSHREKEFDGEEPNNGCKFYRDGIYKG